jgi:hypothetical protein
LRFLSFLTASKRTTILGGSNEFSSTPHCDPHKPCCSAARIGATTRAGPETNIIETTGRKIAADRLRQGRKKTCPGSPHSSSAAQPTSGSPAARISASASSRPLKTAKRTKPPGPIMPGGVGLGPDSAIPRQRRDNRDALRSSVQNCSSNQATGVGKLEPSFRGSSAERGYQLRPLLRSFDGMRVQPLLVSKEAAQRRGNLSTFVPFR